MENEEIKEYKGLTPALRKEIKYWEEEKGLTSSSFNDLISYLDLAKKTIFYTENALINNETKKIVCCERIMQVISELSKPDASFEDLKTLRFFKLLNKDFFKATDILKEKIDKSIQSCTRSKIMFSDYENELKHNEIGEVFEEFKETKEKSSDMEQ